MHRLYPLIAGRMRRHNSQAMAFRQQLQPLLKPHRPLWIETSTGHQLKSVAIGASLLITTVTRFKHFTTSKNNQTAERDNDISHGTQNINCLVLSLYTLAALIRKMPQPQMTDLMR